MTTPYNLSTDYEALYALLEQGNTIIGFVTSQRYENDVCKIKKFETGDYQFMARGIAYGDLPNYWREFPHTFGSGTEIEAFKSVCESLSLKWISL